MRQDRERKTRVRGFDTQQRLMNEQHSEIQRLWMTYLIVLSKSQDSCNDRSKIFIAFKSRISSR